MCYFVLFFCIEIAKYKYEQKALEQRATVLKLYDILIKMKALEQRATVLKLYDIVY